MSFRVHTDTGLATQTELDSVSISASAALPLAGGTMTGGIDMDTNTISNVASSTAAGSFYETATLTNNVLTGTILTGSPTMTFMLSRVGTQVTMFWGPSTSDAGGGSASNIVLTTLIPPGFRPSTNDALAPVMVTNGSISQLGRVQVFTSGNIVFYGATSTNNFTSGTTQIQTGGNISWTTA